MLKQYVAGARYGWYTVWPWVSTMGRCHDTLAEMCYISHNATDIAIESHMTTERNRAPI